MFTLLYAYFALPVLFGLLYLLAVVRIWRNDRTVAVFAFLFLPVGLYALVRYWNADEDNPRVPMLVALALLGLWVGFVGWSLTYQPPQYGNAYGTDGDGGQDVIGQDSVADRLHRAVALANLPWRRGQVDVPAAQASIEVPAHFRFVSAEALQEAGVDISVRLRVEPVGWLVHESVNLADDAAWYIEIEWVGDGFVAADALSAHTTASLLATTQAFTEQFSALGEEAYGLVRFAEAPVLDVADSRLTWVEEIAYADEDAHVLDCYAVKLGRGGALLYSNMDMPMQRQELCLLSVRLAAGRSRFNDGHAYADYSRLFDPKAEFDLVGLVTGEFALPD